ncbi:MAG: protein phosphatase CheZ [Gammaproteobacteria bacterium]|nr:protein phosphatase CheZ [Gammaproteobacteria bacterium]
MSENQKVNQDTLELARQYVKELEAGNQDSADEILAEITDMRESQLFNELGRLTRDFHEAINSFNSDEKIATLAQDEIPDAKKRLTFVIEKTDEAANKTLSAVEVAIPVCEQLETSLNNLGSDWEKFLSREMKPEEFRELSNTIKAFFSDSGRDLQSIKGQLNEILMAQDFQDITGQIIKKVITLVGEVENNLVELIRINSKVNMPVSSAAKKTEAKEAQKEVDERASLEGPQIPGMESDDVIASQDDVDDLLSSLGF